ncbi:MAG: hypothetical protein LAO30_24700 [Acidobacteriia bacterium]|nr:hypothetical protein [Terriglobia bacterium]
MSKWFRPIALIANSQEAISANQLRVALGIEYKTVQRMVQRIREARLDRRIESDAVDVSTLCDRVPYAVSELDMHESCNAANSLASKESRSSTVGNLFIVFTSLAYHTITPSFLYKLHDQKSFD